MGSSMRSKMVPLSWMLVRLRRRDGEVMSLWMVAIW